MAELLNRSKINPEDLAAVWPEMLKLFPATSRYYLKSQNLRICYVFQHQQAKEFLEAVKSRFGRISPHTIRAAVEQALEKWISEG